MYSNESTDQGEWSRQEDEFRDWVTPDGSSAYPAEPGRYHLYVSLACPWAHRTIIVRKLKALEDVVGMTVVDPIRTDDEGWAFRAGRRHSEDPINGWDFLSRAYTASNPDYQCRVTVPGDMVKSCVWRSGGVLGCDDFVVVPDSVLEDDSSDDIG